MTLASSIPIQNLYYLLSYSWNRLEQSALVDISSVGSTHLVDLFATVLIKGLEHLARRGLEVGYRTQSDELRRIRGRVDMLSTQRRLLLKHGRASCVFDDLTTNVLANQIIKATLKLIAKDAEIDSDNRKAVLRLARNFSGVDDIGVTARSFRKIQLNGNNGFYRFLLNVCELVHSALLPEQQEGAYRFRDFLRDEKKMALVFQHFIENFLRIERPDLTVSREIINWRAESVTDASLSFLPQMETDISVLVHGKKVIIDTKYYRETLSVRYGSQRIHSENLYQMFSYLVNAKQPQEEVEGILLYPDVHQKVKLRYSIMGLTVRIETVDLSQPWPAIRDELKQLIH
jgi:5-methylcytosine-specific restriction enzyme subunit McrC